ncbi:lasso peptide biosynthesis B2 protein [Aestuariicoccus sp. MJ-SS9]|uniref:lasso peptide biosynthesis B2 protein n=1 Tax=Aestuariicoccus sp. MJ-SS9 TaxID=3079855 RepID=UPI0029123BA1|nr:lasso peptide biosynthesis B2 protein [Aestuariicoccus sp. MJ-SS9]MDU8913529.1 lasso peptide biosynthesis B2 protein [Aestuariicoccus sp. MJ-SS9]
MSMLSSVRSFLRAPAYRKAQLIEAGLCLALARLLTLLPMRTYTRLCGDARLKSDFPRELSPKQSQAARQVGSAVQRAATVVPFKALCMEQTLAARVMLRLRGVPGTVYIGVHRDPGQRTEDPKGFNAHAWLQTGEIIVVGGPDVSDYVPLAVFR